MWWPVVLAGSSACVDLPAGDDPAVVSKVERKMQPLAPPRAIDLLIVIDIAPSMAGEQAVMAEPMRGIGYVLDLIEGRPSVHVAVVTSDVGTMGASTSATHGARAPATTVGS